jgi:hypothetical protein
MSAFLFTLTVQILRFMVLNFFMSFRVYPTGFPVTPALFPELEEIVQKATKLEATVAAALDDASTDESVIQHLNEEVIGLCSDKPTCFIK